MIANHLPVLCNVIQISKNDSESQQENNSSSKDFEEDVEQLNPQEIGSGLDDNGGETFINGINIEDKGGKIYG